MNPIRGFFRNTRLQTIFILIMALTIGISTYAYLINAQARITQQSELVSVYVAKGEIASGTTFAEIRDSALVEVRQLPVNSIPGDAIRPESTINRELKTRGVLAAGQMMVASYFTSESISEPTLPIPKGMLAVTISVDDVGRVGNFVVPGSKVAIFATAPAGSGNPQTKVLLPEVLVIAIGDQMQAARGTTTLVSPLVTVALSPRDAERVILASQNVRLTLALAHANDPSAVLGAVDSQDARG